MKRLDTLFARLFLVFLGLIVLAHALAFVWLEHYGPPRHPHPHPPPPPAMLPPGALPFGPPPPGEPPPPHKPPGLPLPRGAPLVFQLIALVAAAWIGARLLARPVSRLGEAARGLSDDLDSPPLAESGPAEARQAASAFNRMRERIREQMQERSRMLMAVSHDLRTPLARLRLRAEEIDNPALRERFLQDLGEMRGLLDATLRYLHQERGEEPLQRLDVQALAESLAENAREDGAKASVEGRSAPIEARPLALTSALTNLLENALRYAGEACIRLEDDDRRLRILVVDHGPGIPPEARERVFEPFFRLEQSRNRNSGGVGLGLAIARAALRRQGGELHVEETPGGGLTAVLELPRRSV